MINRKIFANLALITAAVVWGFAFVFQEQAAKHVGTFTVTALRSLIATVAMIPLILVTSKINKRPVFEKTKADRKLLLKAGVLCGALLCISSNIQQYGISLYPQQANVSARSGFITALYVVLVPLCGVFFKKRVSLNVIISVVIATVGLYLLCGTQGLTGVYLGDVIVLLCALCFSLQILCVDHYIDRVDGVKLATIQFFTCGVMSLVPMFIIERPTVNDISLAMTDILYLGLVSSGVGYTLQIIGQKFSDNPTVASILMSLESVFAAIGGWLILSKTLSDVEIAGCIVMFAAIVLAQLDFKKKKA